MSVQDELNRKAGTTNRSSQDAANILAGTTDRSVQDALNIYAGTTNRTKQDALNVKVSRVVAGTVEKVTLTVGGTPEAGDIFSVVLPIGNTTQNTTTISYTVLVADDTTDKIADKINTAIQAYSGYGEMPFSSAVAASVITLTGRSPDFAIVVTPSTTNVTAGVNDQTFTKAITQTRVPTYYNRLSRNDASALL